MLYNTWAPGVAPPNQPFYQTVRNFTYCPILGVFNNWNIIIFSNINTTSEDFEEIHQVILDGISDTMASLVQSGKHDATKTTYSTVMGYYVVNYVSYAYILQEDTIRDG